MIVLADLRFVNVSKAYYFWPQPQSLVSDFMASQAGLGWRAQTQLWSLVLLMPFSISVTTNM